MLEVGNLFGKQKCFRVIFLSKSRVSHESSLSQNVSSCLLKSKKVKESRLSKFCRSINLLYLTLVSQNTKLTHLNNYWRGNNWKSFARNDRLGKASPSARALISALDSVMFWRRLPYLKILNNFALPIFFFFLLSFYVIPEIKIPFKYLSLFIYFHVVFLFVNGQISGFFVRWKSVVWFQPFLSSL